MTANLEHALKLRTDGQLKASNELLLKLSSDCPFDAFLHYQVAWRYDILEEETKAISHYEKAIELNLEAQFLPDAMLVLGSAYRVTGNYQKAK